MRRREIAGLSLNTPLVMPSFSSVDRHARRRLRRVGHLAADCILVSAYDLQYEAIEFGDLLGFDTVFIDSGGYEARIHGERSQFLQCKPLPWTPALYEEVIARLPHGPDYVLVTFDPVDNLPAEEQVERAVAFRDRYESGAIDFLWKPTGKRGFVIEEDFETILPSLGRMDILGVAEQELGVSVARRCAMVQAMRGRLNEAGLETPIHLFGCLNPLAVIVYVRCGADVFDGLGWTRHAYYGFLPMHTRSFRMLSDDRNRADGSFFQDVDGMNLNLLVGLQDALTRFVESKSLNEFLELGGFGLAGFRSVAAKWPEVFREE